MKQSRLYETHVYTKNLEQAVEFYEKKLELELAYIIQERGVAFFFLGEPGKKEFLLGIWEVPENKFRPNHFAFYLPMDKFMEVPSFLESKEIEILGDFGLDNSEPIVHSWQPAASYYFSDPDGNSLEYLTLLEGESRPELGAIHLSEWQKINNLSTIKA
ncbi:VOC family protein [Bacillus sp. CGMCC 1.16607]|uniref:VOC family protein n=1 Tax=Bacillus sp. CGMCC 1.16607 TaxID=3351842 RepID=UPI0036362792